MERREEQGPSGGVTPHLVIGGRQAGDAIDFYTAAFGARELARMPGESGRLMHGHLVINGDSLMLADDFPEYSSDGPLEQPRGCTLHLQVDDADRWWAQAIGAGASVVMPLQDQFWGDRYGILKDPFGHRWSIAAPIQPVE